MYNIENPFDRCGFVSLDDLSADIWRVHFEKLEAYQARFLSFEDQFRSPSYIWPSAPLHKWSRLWEYPYVLYHLNAWRHNMGNGENPSVVDLGSGVTFFPLHLASQGYYVSAVDIDPTGARDFPLACDALGIPKEQLGFYQANAKEMPFDNHSIDMLFSISVLEHISQPDETIEEIRRVLKPDGVFILTIDISLDGTFEITPAPFLQLQQMLAEHFLPVFPEVCIHPMRLLTTLNSPYPYTFPKTGPIRALARTVKRALKGLPLKYPRWLACYGFVGTPQH